MAALYTQGGLAYARQLADAGWAGARRHNVGKDSRRGPGWIRDTLAVASAQGVWWVLSTVAGDRIGSAAEHAYCRFLHRVGDRLANRAAEAVHRDMLSAWRLAGLLPALPKFGGMRAGMHGSVGAAVGFGATTGRSWVWGNTGSRRAGGIKTVLSEGAQRDPVARRGYTPFLEAAIILAHEAAHTVFGAWHAPLRLAEGHPGHDAVRGLNRSVLGSVAREGGNEHQRAMDEMFADTYGAMLVLETFGHSETVLDELRLFRDIRAANSKAFHAGLVEDSADGSVPACGRRGGGIGLDAYGTAEALTRVIESHAAWQGKPGHYLMETARGIVSECWFERFIEQPSRHGMQPAAGKILAAGGDRQVILNPEKAPLLLECCMSLVYEGRAGVREMLDNCEQQLGRHPYIDFWRKRFDDAVFGEWFPGFEASGDGEAVRRGGRGGRFIELTRAFDKACLTLGRLNEGALAAWRAGGEAARSVHRDNTEVAEVFGRPRPGGGLVAERTAPPIASSLGMTLQLGRGEPAPQHSAPEAPPSVPVRARPRGA